MKRTNIVFRKKNLTVEHNGKFSHHSFIRKVSKNLSRKRAIGHNIIEEPMASDRGWINAFFKIQESAKIFILDNGILRECNVSVEFTELDKEFMYAKLTIYHK